MKLDDTICYCFHITQRKILNFIRINNPRRASQISECGGAGTGCGWCIAYLKRYFEAAQTAGPLEATCTDDVEPEAYARLRGEYIRAGRGVPAQGAIPPPPAETSETIAGNQQTQTRGDHN